VSAQVSPLGPGQPPQMPPQRSENTPAIELDCCAAISDDQRPRPPRGGAGRLQARARQGGGAVVSVARRRFELPPLGGVASRTQ
jgi:hypothetical protein